MAGAAQADDVRRAIVMACSRMLSYPGRPEFAAELAEAREELGELGVGPGSPAAAAVDALLGQAPLELAEEYVARFDLAQETTLHLTAHEHGDGRERGPALLALAQLYRAAGWLPDDRQLSDFLPQLLEFLAVEDDGERAELRALEARVAAVCRRIGERLPDGSAYRLVFAALDAACREAERAPVPARAPAPLPEDDPEDMPYPLHYE